MYIELEPKGKVFIMFLIILGAITFLSTRSTDVTPPAGVGGNYPGAITGFYRIPPQNAEQLMNENPSAVVVDCNPGGSDFISGKKLPRAVWSPDANIYVGQHMLLLLYSTPDNIAIDYARSLVGRTYGEIYVMEGGYQGWENWINRAT